MTMPAAYGLQESQMFLGDALMAQNPTTRHLCWRSILVLEVEAKRLEEGLPPLAKAEAVAISTPRPLLFWCPVPRDGDTSFSLHTPH